MEICSFEKCTGCMACSSVCPTSAVTTKPDIEGFLHPEIDFAKCKNCGLCLRVCPQNGKRSKESNGISDRVYACWLKNSRIRKKSTSGGAFTALANTVLNQNGVVFGAGFDSELRVIHKAIFNVGELDQLRGSKYVQSFVGESFKQVKKYLMSDKKVLFTGTPCQVDGLYHYLGDRFEERLWTIDLVCHGVPSPMVFRDYKDSMENAYNSKIQKAYFRDKTPGWFVFGMKLVFENGLVYQKDTYHDPYIRGFLRNYFLRPSCYNCIYANQNRVADITLSDFWGYEDTCKRDWDDDKGISMVMLNTENGENLFALSRKQMEVFERPRNNAVESNQALREPFQEPEDRSEFWNDYDKLKFEQIVEKYFYSEEPNDWVKNRLVNLKRRHQYQQKDAIKNLPQNVAKKLLGKKRYMNLKRIIKGE